MRGNDASLGGSVGRGYGKSKSNYLAAKLRTTAPPNERPTRTNGPFSPSFERASFSSKLSCANVRGFGPGSLQASPARSYVQMRADRATRDCTRAQSNEKSPRPFYTTIAGAPCPEQCTWSICPPRSTSFPGGFGGLLCSARTIFADPSGLLAATWSQPPIESPACKIRDSLARRAGFGEEIFFQCNAPPGWPLGGAERSLSESRIGG